MKTPAWLAEFHRQWHRARGKNLAAASRPFSRRWEDLLDAAGLHTASDRNQALREAEGFHSGGHLRLRRHRYRRHLVEAIDLPLESEPWLGALFGGTSAEVLRDKAVFVVRKARSQGHPRCPESWNTLCTTLQDTFADGRRLGPFSWKAPDELDALLQVLHTLTAREWPPGTLIRDASTTLGLPSKALEEKQKPLESALGILFGEETPLESLGLLANQSLTTIHGPLRLHFEDGTVQDFENLQGAYGVSLPDLQRTVNASTTADRILSIENAKTTFRQAVTANTRTDTLLVATSFPNAATRRLLQILPPELPHYHFGDTDPSGYAILRSLREIDRRPVARFLMDWRDRKDSPPLSERDRRLLPALKNSPHLTDCRSSLLAMEQAGRKGDFEQEALGPPTRNHWPFWMDAPAGSQEPG